jgi:hypothetical protein
MTEDQRHQVYLYAKRRSQEIQRGAEMTHNEMIEALTQPVAPNRVRDPFAALPQRDALEIAERLDRYRELIERALPILDPDWQDELQLMADIREALK